MDYTTQGLMTALDLQDHQELHDQHRHPNCPGHDVGAPWSEYCTAAMDCPGEATGSGGGRRVRMGTYERMTMYFAQSASGRMTARQRRRLIKKAGRDPEYSITRTDGGMGYPASKRGLKELAMNFAPTSGAPY